MERLEKAKNRDPWKSFKSGTRRKMRSQQRRYYEGERAGGSQSWAEEFGIDFQCSWKRWEGAGAERAEERPRGRTVHSAAAAAAVQVTPKGPAGGIGRQSLGFHKHSTASGGRNVKVYPNHTSNGSTPPAISGLSVTHSGCFHL